MQELLFVLPPLDTITGVSLNGKKVPDLSSGMVKLGRLPATVVIKR